MNFGGLREPLTRRVRKVGLRPRLEWGREDSNLRWVTLKAGSRMATNVAPESPPPPLSTETKTKTHGTTGEYTKGDTLRGTSILRNAVRQFGKPKGARVGTSRFVEVALSPQRLRFDGVSRLPGGTLHARGVMREVAGKLTVAVVGGTGLYAAATGVIEGSHLPSGVTLDVARLQVP